MIDKIIKLIPEEKRRTVYVSAGFITLFVLVGVFNYESEKKDTNYKKTRIETISLTQNKFDRLNPASLSSEIKDLQKDVKEYKKSSDKKVETLENTLEKFKSEKNKLKLDIRKKDDESRIQLKKLEDKLKLQERENKRLTEKVEQVRKLKAVSVSSGSTLGSNNIFSKPSPTDKESESFDGNLEESSDIDYTNFDFNANSADVYMAINNNNEVPDIVNITMDEDEDGGFSMISEEDNDKMIISAITEDEQSDRELTEELLSKEKNKRNSIYLPTGSIISGTLITGGDFPTSISFKNDPYPLLLRVKMDAILPNYASADIKECFLVAEGHGELSSERAMIRGNTISCVFEGGGAVEADINAYASGDDGKVGIRGRLVSKQGAIIGKAMLAGFVDGIGKAFAPLGVVTAGSITTPNAQEVAENAGMSGASNAMSRLSAYYIKMADEVFPIVEVEAGRSVSFIMKSGVDLTLPSK